MNRISSLLIIFSNLFIASDKVISHQKIRHIQKCESENYTFFVVNIWDAHKNANAQYVSFSNDCLANIGNKVTKIPMPNANALYTLFAAEYSEQQIRLFKKRDASQIDTLISN